MALRFIGKDDQSPGGQSPTVWVDEESKTIVIQGWRLDDPAKAEVHRTAPVPPHETVLRVPARMAKVLREACNDVEPLE